MICSWITKYFSCCPTIPEIATNEGPFLILMEYRTRCRIGCTRWFTVTEFTCNGKVGYGMSEYLDQIIDGKPVGME